MRQFGIVISEFGNIDELLEEMGISPSSNSENHPVIENEEAMEFISLKEKTSYMIATGVGFDSFGSFTIDIFGNAGGTQSDF